MGTNQPDPPSRWLAISQCLFLIGSIGAAVCFGAVLKHQAHELAVRIQLRHALRLTMADHSLSSDRLISRDAFQQGEFIYLGELRGPVYVMTVSAEPGSRFHGKTLSGCVNLASGTIDIEAGFSPAESSFCPAVTQAPALPERRHGG